MCCNHSHLSSPPLSSPSHSPRALSSNQYVPFLLSRLCFVLVWPSEFMERCLHEHGGVGCYLQDHRRVTGGYLNDSSFPRNHSLPIAQEPPPLTLCSLWWNGDGGQYLVQVLGRCPQPLWVLSSSRACPEDSPRICWLFCSFHPLFPWAPERVIYRCP